MSLSATDPSKLRRTLTTMLLTVIGLLAAPAAAFAAAPPYPAPPADPTGPSAPIATDPGIALAASTDSGFPTGTAVLIGAIVLLVIGAAVLILAHRPATARHHRK